MATNGRRADRLSSQRRGVAPNVAVDTLIEPVRPAGPAARPRSGEAGGTFSPGRMAPGGGTAPPPRPAGRARPSRGRPPDPGKGVGPHGGGRPTDGAGSPGRSAGAAPLGRGGRDFRLRHLAAGSRSGTPPRPDRKGPTVPWTPY